MPLSNKVIILTGAAGVIGRVFSEAILSNNGTIILADINEESCNKLKIELSRNYPENKIRCSYLDITSKKSINEMMSIVSNESGHIDALVNNAYPKNEMYGAKLEDVTYESFCDNVSMHLGGYFLMCQQLAAHFKDQGHGNIINIASIYGVIAPRFDIYENTDLTMPIEYAVIKSSIIHLTKYLTRYFKNTNIRFNTLSPGGILDNQPPSFIKKYNENGSSKGMLSANDLVGTLIFLLSESSQYISGQNIIVDDGWTL